MLHIIILGFGLESGRAREGLHEVIPLAERKPQPNHTQWNPFAAKEKLLVNDIKNDNAEARKDGYLVHLRHNLECLELARIFPSYRTGKMSSDERTGPV